MLPPTIMMDMVYTQSIISEWCIGARPTKASISYTLRKGKGLINLNWYWWDWGKVQMKADITHVYIFKTYKLKLNI